MSNTINCTILHFTNSSEAPMSEDSAALEEAKDAAQRKQKKKRK